MGQRTLSERWKQVEGWPYEISSLGRVRRLPVPTFGRDGRTRRFKGLHKLCVGSRTLNLHDGSRYYRVRLYQKAMGKTFKVHHLVLEAFVGSKPSPTHECRHLNGDATDNRVENLCWGTRKENIRDAVRHGTWDHKKRRGVS